MMVHTQIEHKEARDDLLVPCAALSLSLTHTRTKEFLEQSGAITTHCEETYMVVACNILLALQIAGCLTFLTSSLTAHLIKKNCAN
jgi:hypothetical protein